jgi:hypothetical protein
MIHLCEYGCGQPAIHFKTPSPKVPDGRWSCAPSPNSCPAKRSKTTGDNNPSRRPEVRKVISKINSVLFASDSDLRKQCQTTLKTRYGVDNPMAIKKVVENLVADRRSKNNYYPFPKEANSLSANKKRKETRIERGYDLDPALKTDWQRYEQEVDRLTNQNYKKYKEIINPNNLTRGRTCGTYQLDHIMSKMGGFNEGVAPELIAHPANLKMLTASENQSKNSKSHYTKDELLEAIKSYQTLL